LSPSSSVLLLAKTIMHPAARSLCNSWASCNNNSNSAVCGRSPRQHNLVRNTDVCCITEQLSLFSTVRSRRFSLFGHMARMDGKTDMNKILFWAHTIALEKTPQPKADHTLPRAAGDEMQLGTTLLKAVDFIQYHTVIVLSSWTDDHVPVNLLVEL